MKILFRCFKLLRCLICLYFVLLLLSLPYFLFLVHHSLCCMPVVWPAPRKPMSKWVEDGVAPSEELNLAGDKAAIWKSTECSTIGLLNKRRVKRGNRLPVIKSRDSQISQNIYANVAINLKLPAFIFAKSLLKLFFFLPHFSKKIF